MQVVKFTDLSPEIQADIVQAAAETEHSFPSNRSTKFGAVLRADGQQFGGANIRRRAFSSNTCAERMVIDKALYAGVKSMEHLVVYGKSLTKPFETPAGSCGTCRQVILDALIELKQEDLPIYISDQAQQKVIVTSLTELMPVAYREQESQLMSSAVITTE